MKIALSNLAAAFLLAACMPHRARAETYPPRPVRMPAYQFVFELCRERQQSCVLDLTSKRVCVQEFSLSGKSMSQELDALTHACPQFKWRKAGVVFVIESSDSSDTILNMPAGPVSETSSDVENLLSALLKSAGPPISGRTSLASIYHTRPLVKAPCSLVRRPLKEALIASAKCIHPLFLGIYRAVAPKEDRFYRINDSPVEELNFSQHLMDACGVRRQTCVFDLTSQNPCSPTLIPRAGPIAKELDAFVGACPQYVWRKTDAGIYLVEPSTPSESALTVDVGPIKSARIDAGQVLSRLFTDSGFVYGVTVISNKSGGGAGIERLIKREEPPIQRQVTIERMPFKAALMKAAVRFRPSVWLVSYGGIDPESGKAGYFWSADSERVQQ